MFSRSWMTNSSCTLCMTIHFLSWISWTMSWIPSATRAVWLRLHNTNVYWPRKRSTLFSNVLVILNFVKETTHCVHSLYFMLLSHLYCCERDGRLGRYESKELTAHVYLPHCERHLFTRRSIKDPEVTREISHLRELKKKNRKWWCASLKMRSKAGNSYVICWRNWYKTSLKWDFYINCKDMCTCQLLTLIQISNAVAQVQRS